LTACDIDPAVLDNPFADEKVVIEEGRPLPFSDASFDLIHANFVFEHVGNPDFVSKELLRVLRPGGYVCAMTPNKWGYPAVAARMVRNKWHAGLLGAVQPSRQEIDVFPTRYLLNTRASIMRYFGRGAEVVAYPYNPEPSYHFGSKAVYLVQNMLHKCLPSALAVSWMIFARSMRWRPLEHFARFAQDGERNPIVGSACPKSTSEDWTG
jgi:SAM-dependent methyltransferase